jgi:hypothetical protein
MKRSSKMQQEFESKRDSDFLFTNTMILVFNRKIIFKRFFVFAK